MPLQHYRYGGTLPWYAFEDSYRQSLGRPYYYEYVVRTGYQYRRRAPCHAMRPQSGNLHNASHGPKQSNQGPYYAGDMDWHAGRPLTLVRYARRHYPVRPCGPCLALALVQAQPTGHCKR